MGIIPNNNLATNIGFGRKDATHTKLNSRFAEQKIEPIDFPLIIPNRIERDCDADEFTQKNNYVLWKEMLMNLFRKICIIYRKCVGGK